MLSRTTDFGGCMIIFFCLFLALSRRFLGRDVKWQFIWPKSHNIDERAQFSRGPSQGTCKTSLYSQHFYVVNQSWALLSWILNYITLPFWNTTQRKLAREMKTCACLITNELQIGFSHVICGVVYYFHGQISFGTHSWTVQRATLSPVKISSSNKWAAHISSIGYFVSAMLSGQQRPNFCMSPPDQSQWTNADPIVGRLADPERQTWNLIRVD